ncbi:MAG: hypothetical protein KDE55_12610 [Novosphingobium sp.]|nr:hypothetical protein [Novosphingobium sp.]
MPVSLIHGCCQIETCAADLDAVRAFLVNALGGVPAEQELARQISDLIPGNDYDVDHIDCGQAILQINRPSPAMAWKGSPSVHQRYLEERCPCVTNLNFFVDDIAHARALLTGMGAATLIEGPSSSARALADYGPENTRPGGDERPFLFMGTRDLIGFDLEIMEANFLHFTQQSVQYPAYVQPRPCGNGNGFVMDRLIVDVPDLDRVLANLTAIFSPGSLSKPYALRQTTLGRSVRAWLGGIEIEYVAPASSANLQASPDYGTIDLAFSCDDPALAIRDCEEAGFAVEKCELDPLGTPCNSPSWRVASRAVVGFDVILELSS